jgi:hypothetical protein
VHNQEGVVVFPSLLSPEVVELLRGHVVEVCEGISTGVDRSANIRKPQQRTLRAVGVRERPEAMEAIASELQLFLDACLRGTSSEKSSFW